MCKFVRVIKRLLIFLFLFSAKFSFAQLDVFDFGEENGKDLNVLYRNDISVKAYATTRGLGFSFRRGKHITGKKRYFYEGDFQSLRHPKEVRVEGESSARKRFVYGKLNSVYLFRGAVGYQNVIFSKADNKAVEVRYSVTLGPTFAFAKPYYVQVFRSRSSNDRINTDDVPFNEKTFTTDSVVGRGYFSSGLDKTKILPGLHTKFNLSFEYANYTNLIRAIETGITLDVFPQQLRIMARNPAENVVVTFHVGFVMGRKWF